MQVIMQPNNNQITKIMQPEQGTCIIQTIFMIINIVHVH